MLLATILFISACWFAWAVGHEMGRRLGRRQALSEPKKQNTIEEIENQIKWERECHALLNAQWLRVKAEKDLVKLMNSK